MEMKLLVVLSIKEHKEEVAKLLQAAGIKRFSIADITGYKKKNKNVGWFAIDGGNMKVDSIMLFSFATKELVDKAIEEIDKCNDDRNISFPVHAFVLDVDNFSKLL